MSKVFHKSTPFDNVVHYEMIIPKIMIFWAGFGQGYGFVRFFSGWGVYWMQLENRCFSAREMKIGFRFFKFWVQFLKPDMLQ